MSHPVKTPEPRLIVMPESDEFGVELIQERSVEGPRWAPHANSRYADAAFQRAFVGCRI